MAFREQYITLAKELAGESPIPAPSKESKCRSAISRAYFGALNIASDFLEQKRDEQLDQDASKHGKIVRLLKQDKKEEARDAGYLLGMLRLDRNKADYGNQIKDIDKTTKGSILNATNVKSKLFKAGR